MGISLSHSTTLLTPQSHSSSSTSLPSPHNLLTSAPSQPTQTQTQQRRAYRITSWTDSYDFLTQLARASGKLLKGGDPDLNTAARMVLYDWQRGKIPFYTLPPGYTDEKPPKPGSAAAVAAAAAAAAAEDGGAQQQQQNGSDAAAVAAAKEGEEEEGAVMYAEGVTEEDALLEAGARAENASAAARAMREAAAAALRSQRRGRIPIKEGYYLPGDERAGDEGAGDEEAAADEDEISQEESDGAEEVSGSEDGFEGEEGDSSGSGGDDDDAEEEEGAGGRSGDESDGYGEAGLSWEAVLQAVQVRLFAGSWSVVGVGVGVQVVCMRCVGVLCHCKLGSDHASQQASLGDDGFVSFGV